MEGVGLFSSVWAWPRVGRCWNLESSQGTLMSLPVLNS